MFFCTDNKNFMESMNVKMLINKNIYRKVELTGVNNNSSHGIHFHLCHAHHSKFLSFNTNVFNHINPLV